MLVLPEALLGAYLGQVPFPVAQDCVHMCLVLHRQLQCSGGGAETVGDLQTWTVRCDLPLSFVPTPLLRALEGDPCTSQYPPFPAEEGHVELDGPEDEPGLKVDVLCLLRLSEQECQLSIPLLRRGKFTNVGNVLHLVHLELE